jgi:hypothetical protein
MTRRQKDIDAQNREMDALADRWELRIHAIAFTLTAVVLAMRLVAGRQDLTSEGYWEDANEHSPPAGEALGSLPADVNTPATEPERTVSGDDRGSSPDIPVEAARAADVRAL